MKRRVIALILILSCIISCSFLMFTSCQKQQDELPPGASMEKDALLIGEWKDQNSSGDTIIFSQDICIFIYVASGTRETYSWYTKTGILYLTKSGQENPVRFNYILSGKELTLDRKQYVRIGS